jgi:hypothetical protein
MTPQQRENVRVVCASEPNHETCRKLEVACMGTYKVLHAEDQALCRLVGYSPEQHANRLIRELKNECDTDDGDTCVELRASCREDRLTCEQLKSLVCKLQSGPHCDEQYLCAPDRLRSVCSGKSDPGAMHMLIHANYASVDSALGDFMVSGSAIAHGQVGESMLNLNYVLDMGLGWLKGDDSGLGYDLNILMGIEARKGAKGMIGVSAGGGFSGIAGAGVGFGWTFSTEARGRTRNRCPRICAPHLGIQRGRTRGWLRCAGVRRRNDRRHDRHLDEEEERGQLRCRHRLGSDALLQ